jgi:hypothetical protein
MKKILDTIINFNIETNKMIIKCKKINIVLPILNGTVQVNIANELKDKIGINEININDNIIIFYRDLNYVNIKPIKIIKLFNYKFNDDSSENDIDF